METTYELVIDENGQEVRKEFRNFALAMEDFDAARERFAFSVTLYRHDDNGTHLIGTFE